MTQIAATYGQALYDLAKEENLEQTVLEQMDVLQQAFAAQPTFITLLNAPNLSKQERCQILDESFRECVHIYVLNFLKILTEKGYMGHFSECCKAFRQYYNDAHAILPVQVVTAVAMQEQQAQRLTEKLSNLTGKTVQLSCKVDPAVLGGVRLDYDGKRVDGTVKNRLDNIRDLLKNTVL